LGKNDDFKLKMGVAGGKPSCIAHVEYIQHWHLKS